MAVWEKDSRDALAAMIVRPDGSAARSVISYPASGPGVPEAYGQAKIALDASGDATIVFAHYVARRGALRHRTRRRGRCAGPRSRPSGKTGRELRARSRLLPERPLDRDLG